MVSILKVLYHIMSKKRFVLFLFVSAVVIAAGFAASKIKLEEDITKAIPFGDDGDEYNRILNEFKFLDRIVFRVFYTKENETENFRELAEFADEFVKELKKSDAASLISTYSTDRMEFDTFKIHGHFYENLPLFLEEEDYAYLEKSMENEELPEILNSLYKNMVTPSGMVSAKYIRKDPFSLTFRAMEKLKSVNPESNFQIIDGHIYTLDRTSLIFFVEPAIEGSETGRNSELVRIMDILLKDLSEKTGSKIKGEYFGSLPIAVGSAERIKKDVINSSLAAVLLVFLILLFYFRKIRFIPLIFIPAIFGGLIAVAFTALFKGTVSAISLGITSVLLGITVDYAIHAVSHILKRKNTGEAISELSFPMILSCFTTVAAFACLLFLDSSALNDLGLLALVSVLSAMLFSVIVIPHIVDLMKGVRKETDFEKENSIISRISAFEFEKRKGAVITVLMLTLGFYFFSKNTAFEDDLNNINYMKPETVEAMNNIDRISSINKKSVYLVFSGKTFDEVLEKREHGEKLISGLVEKGLADSVTDISKLVMSKKEQLEKIEKWNSFFTPERKEKLKNSLITEGLKLGFKEETFLPFFELIDSGFKPVEPEELTKFAPQLFDEWTAGSDNGYMTASLLKLSGPDSSEISKHVSG
ncbi:MAG TPA: MMPL family transporter, partial [bacterium]|nr:MMPL family transporter [bacterium]